MLCYDAAFSCYLEGEIVEMKHISKKYSLYIVT